jgi:RNA polymerase sigma-70 factor (ECF subfamily)
MADGMIRELEFNLLCQRHADAIYRYARSLLGNEADAQDATQEVLVRVWDNLHKIKLFRARAWILRTTRHYCIDQIRRRANLSTPMLVDDDLLDAQADDLAADPSQAADCTFQLERARAALARLPETLRSVFVLYEVNGLRYREIAQTLGIPINTVKVYLFRARARLSKLIATEQLCNTTCKD